MIDRVKKRILLSGHRYGITAGLLVIMTAVVLIPDFTRFTIRNITPLFYISSALIGGNITLITVVVAINQVILSQELESPGSLRDEIERTAEFRRDAIEESTVPIEPAEFLQQLLGQTREHAQSLEGLFPDSTEEYDNRLLDELPSLCEHVSDQLDDSSNKLSSVIVPLLDLNYAEYIQDCYELELNYEEEDHEELFAGLDALSSDLENLDIAEQYFTTAFMKEELATLSRVLVYIGVVAVSLPIALLYQLATYHGASPPMPGLFSLTVVTVVVGLTPLAVLIAFILRVASVTQYMAAITPFNA